MKRLAVILALLLLTGCARTLYAKPGATAEDFERDKAACRYEAARAADPIFASLYFGDCLKGRGWVVEKQ